MNIMNMIFAECQKQQKKRAGKERVFHMPLWTAKGQHAFMRGLPLKKS